MNHSTESTDGNPNTRNGSFPGLGDSHSAEFSAPVFQADYKWGKEHNIYANRYRDTSKRFRGFGNLIALWKGSVVKLVSKNARQKVCSTHN